MGQAARERLQPYNLRFAESVKEASTSITEAIDALNKVPTPNGAAEKAIEEARLAAAKAEEARQAALLAEEKAKAAAAKAEEEARIAAAKAEEIAKLRAAAGIVDPAPAKPLDTTINEPAAPAVSEAAPMRPAAAVRPGSEAAPTRPAAKPAV